MRVQLLPFGVMKDFLSSTSLELPSGASVEELLQVLREKSASGPRLEQMLSRIAVSVNAEYAHASQILRDGDQVGLLPPVSGGSGEGPTLPATCLSREIIPSAELIAAIRQGSDGAVVTFEGIVRDNTRGRKTLFLDYEAYEVMASKQLASLASEAIARFGVRGVTIIHRLGRLQIGETSVLIVVASAHRAAAFDACRWLIDTLKKTVPIWKKETFADGSVWADGELFPPELATGSVDRALEPSS